MFDKARFMELTEEWLAIYRKGKSSKFPAEKAMLRKRMQEINQEQEQMAEEYRKLETSKE